MATRRSRGPFQRLRALSSFSPCHLRKNKAERDAIVRLLFRNGEGPLTQEIGDERRQTLTLILDYARALRTSKQHFPDPVGFLDSCYANALPDGTAWAPPAGLTAVGTGWAIYKRHELLAVAVQGLFWAGLTALLDEGGFAADGVAYRRLHDPPHICPRQMLSACRSRSDATSDGTRPGAERSAIQR